MGYFNKKFCVWLMAAFLFISICPIYGGAASASVLYATDGNNYLASSPDSIVSYTAGSSDITLAGIVTPVFSEVSVKVRSVADTSKIVYVRQTASDVHGMFSFSFSTDSFEPDTYEIIVNTEGNGDGKKKYFTIPPSKAPAGAQDVFSCFTVNGRSVSFDSTNYAFVSIPAQERDIKPVFDIQPADSGAKVIVEPAQISKIPCALKVSVEYSGGNKKVYSLLLDEISDRSISDFQVASEAGKCVIEDDIRLGTSTKNASLVYTDRTNVYWSNASSAIFEGATQIKRAENDAGGVVSDEYTPADKFPKIKDRAYYGGAYSGQNGEPYWMSFVVNADATVYMADSHRAGWPNNPPGDEKWKNDSIYIVKNGAGGASASGSALYYKEFKAGDRVNIPNYGLKEGWPAKNAVVYDPPVYVIVWKSNGTISGTDAGLTQLSYSADGAPVQDVENFGEDNGTYVITVPEGTQSVALSAVKSDENASLSTDLSAPISLLSDITTKEIRVVSAGNIIERTYTVIIKRKSENVVWGDIDGDGEVTGSDAIWILRGEIGLSVPVYMDISAGDVDGDGEVTGSDAIWILRYEIGLSIPESVRIG